MVTLAKKVRGRLVGRRVTEIHAAATVAALGPAVPGAPAAAVLTAPAALVPGAETEGKVVTCQWVEDRTRAFLKGKLADDHIFRLGDGTFYLPTVEEVKAILSTSQLDRRTYMAERFDCDDYSYVLKDEMSAHAYEVSSLKFGFCVGIVWGNFAWVQGFHAINWFIDSNEQLMFIEPQNDQIYPDSDSKGGINLLVV